MADELTPDLKQQKIRSRALSNGLEFDESRYEFNDAYVPAKSKEEIHNVSELVKFAENDNSIEIEAKVLSYKPNEKIVGYRNLNKSQFIESSKKEFDKKRFKESVDSFALDDFDGSRSAVGLVGDDFIPLLGGPFNKQLYYYDYLRMIAIAFMTYHHDPIAHRFVQIMKQFVLGRGYRTDVKGKDKDKGLALWRALERANNFERMIEYACVELSVYGEEMIWRLPNKATKITYDVRPGQNPPPGLLNRYRLIDPSCIWEIVTYPEDIERVLYYQWVAPTQYQIYTGSDAGQPVPTTKFIVQQVPADQIKHYKINSVSNEKRGRSDLFSILGYLKRLRDSVNYSIIRDQKVSAWCIDTEINGSQSDVDAYVSDQQSMGTIAPAGSEFVHTAAVKRNYLAAQSSGGTHGSSSFDWCLSMACIGFGVPINYLGAHISGATTRASAVTMTEPVVKMFEDRQRKLERMLQDIAEENFREWNLDCELEVTFPEIMPGDRSAKIKDVITVMNESMITHQRASEMCVKELNVSEYEYAQEMTAMKSDPTPLPIGSPSNAYNPQGGSAEEEPDTQAMSSQDKSDLKDQLTQ